MISDKIFMNRCYENDKRLEINQSKILRARGNHVGTRRHNPRPSPLTGRRPSTIVLLLS